MDKTLFEALLQLHDSNVKSHGLSDAEVMIRKGNPDQAEEVINEFNRRVGVQFGERGLIDDDLERWFIDRPAHEWPRWRHAKRQLGLDPAIVERVSLTSNEILARIANPASTSIATRGLVLGHVQSGKTTSFLSVAAKAVDCGYKLVIILAGIHNSLRQQTEDRARRTLVHNPNRWWVGTVNEEFRPGGNMLASNLYGNGKRGLLVVKKNKVVLSNLAGWLEKMSDKDLRDTSILIIDDEADQAGLDVSTSDELTGVHKELHRIVNLQTAAGERRCAYVAYTATPYANILTSPDEFGLYPRDFIYPLEKPSNYLGPSEFFGDDRLGEPVAIERDESDEILTDGLRDALRWFVLATAARAHLEGPLSSFHSSMLIHTTQRKADQAAYLPVVKSYLRDLRDEFRTSGESFRSFYEATMARVPVLPEGGEGVIAETSAPWMAVESGLGEVLHRLIDDDGSRSGVVVDNSDVDDENRLAYPDLRAGEPGITVIAIGGNTLSRGLTLEGLVCSYFARAAKNYDTLMQMGRWFGYRPGYRHLVRIWMTQSLYEWFGELDEIERDLREELIWMQAEGRSPKDYGPRIRESPHMNITRAAAMKSVRRHISYSNRVLDPAWLNLDREALENNLILARRLASRISDVDPPTDRARIARSVPLDHVIELLENFRLHPDEKRFDIPSLLRYIEKEHVHLERWNVVFRSNVGSTARFNFGGEIGEVMTVIRGRQPQYPIARIQSLVDSKDHRVDVDSAKPPDGSQYRSADEPPLLIVYAVDPTSTPPPKSHRVALNAEITPIAFAIAMPRSGTTVNFVSPAHTPGDDSRDSTGGDDAI